METLVLTSHIMGAIWTLRKKGIPSHHPTNLATNSTFKVSIKFQQVKMYDWTFILNVLMIIYSHYSIETSFGDAISCCCMKEWTTCWFN